MKFVSLPPPPHLSLRLAAAGLAACALGLPMAAQAASANTSFTVTANVLAKCTITAANLNFGDYDPTNVNPNDASSTITVRCNKNKAYDVGLDAGTFSGATVTTRTMTGADTAGLSYGLYQDAARGTNWGNTIGTDTAHGTGSGSDQYLTVYGRIPAGQSVVDGSYADTITATITY
jgi:spore coat protein U-like protein